MTILLQWLVEHVWVFYAACAIGAIIYLVRALVAHRERALAMFTLEHETATARAIRAWVMVFVFIAMGIAIFVGVTFILPELDAYDPEAPLPTSTPRAGVTIPTPSLPPTTTGTIILPTLTPATVSPPTLPPVEPSEPAPTETPTPTAELQGGASGDLQVRFGDFATLVGYSLAATEVTPSEALALTLYWRALEGTSPANYVVFTHLLAEDGTLIAQHDSPPANGARPIPDWESGETIVDIHSLAFKPESLDYTGSATVMVGLYDPGNPDARVVTGTGNDYVTLPVTVDVVSP